MSVTADRRKRDFEQREALILRAAREMFAEVGFLNLKMAELARAAEYSTGTLYQHFSSKEDLLLAMSADVHLKLIERVDRLSADFERTRDRVTAVCLAHAEYTRRDPEGFRSWQLSMLHSIWNRASAARQDQVMSIDRRGKAMLKRDVDAAISAGDLSPDRGSVEEIALSLFSMLLGTYTVTNEAKPFELLDTAGAYALLRRNITSFLNGIAWKPIGMDLEAIDHLVCERIDEEERAGLIHG